MRMLFRAALAALLAGSGLQAQSADASTNLWACREGYDSLCKEELLSAQELASVTQQRNQRTEAAEVACAENGSCYGDISSETGRPKTVYVRGYTRRDGTYVRGQYRSPPRRP